MSKEPRYYYGLMVPVPVNNQTLWLTVRFHGDVGEAERAALPKPGPHIIEWPIPAGADPSKLYGLGKMPILCHGEQGFTVYESKYAPGGTALTISEAIAFGTWEREPRF